MNQQLLIAEFLATPWALMPERLNAVAAVLARWSRNTPASEDVMQRIAADRSAREARRQSNQVNGGGAGNGIAVLPLYGMVTQRGNMVDDVSGPGSVSTQQFAASLRQALTDESVSQILIDIDSPGGSVYGVAELADEIISARAQKPVIAIANSLAASAAYWIGACASEFYVTPGGEVGSIGVWQAHQDYSKAMDEAGVKTTLISAGKFKVEGNPYTPLDEDAQAFMQSRVDDYYAAFTKAVAKGRGVSIAQVRDGMGQGRVLGAEAALASNMVDGIASLDDVVRKMRRNAKVQNKPQASRLLQARNSLAYL
ncbi:S49 family peptidase [Limnohabitans sp. MMS-10A-192]|uniref:S49 family peptidase n=1 Tax=Limnohabitans sp. MMS-10A-192 TaxID=1835769 RepID=UPI000D37BA98|nr:S49 family peptidase [Limnohabitans sp. MMS-10A-192]